MKYFLLNNHDFNNNKLTGAHRRFLELIKYLAENENNEIILATRNIKVFEGIKNIKYIPYKEVKFGFLPSHICGFLSMLKTIPKNLNFDIAISFAPINTLCIKIKGYKNIVSLFREDLIGYQESLGTRGPKLKYFLILERIAVKVSNLVIVQCENDRNNLIRRTRKYIDDVDKKILIQINNANASWMKVDCLKKKVFNDIPSVLFIGDFSNERKGHGILLPAMKKLADEGYKFKLFLAGDGIELEKYRDEYGKNKQFVFLERVSNIRKYLEQADFMLVPSLIDSCPNTVLEGLNAGVAVYGSNSGGIPDLLANKEYLFEPNSNDIYEFSKKVLDGKTYIEDSNRQNERKKELTFNWGKAIETVISNYIKNDKGD